MRTERDVRENPVAGDVWRHCEAAWEGGDPVDYTVQAVVGNLVAYTTNGTYTPAWVTLDLWEHGYLTCRGRALHIAQPGGDA